MLGIPKELDEAAMVDGASRFGAFVRILLPLVGARPGGDLVFAFIQAWNEFISPTSCCTARRSRR